MSLTWAKYLMIKLDSYITHRYFIPYNVYLYLHHAEQDFPKVYILVAIKSSLILTEEYRQHIVQVLTNLHTKT